MDTEGTATFTMRAYIDKIYTYQALDSPLLSMDMVGGDVGLLEAPSPTQPRTTSDERRYGFPAKFDILKLRFSGTTTLPIRFISVTLGYIMGSIRR